MIQSYPWYIADWRESETRIRLSLPERALYRELLDYCYLEGSLPNEEIQLSRIASCTVAEVRRYLPAVQPLFYLEGERMLHSKVNEVRAKLAKYHEQKRHAGSASGRTRRERALEREMNGRSTGVPTQDEPSPTPTPTPSPEPAPSMPLPSQSEYPLTIAEIRKHDAAVDDIFVLRLVQESIQYCLSSPKFPQEQLPEITDKVMAAVCRESYATGPPGHRTGLLLKRVPNILVSWSLEETNGKTR
jgi:uncharacterized protein YdaU (DUF1376 family)